MLVLYVLCIFCLFINCELLTIQNDRLCALGGTSMVDQSIWPVASSCDLLCCNSVVGIKRGRIAPAPSWTQLAAPLPSYYFTLCRSELAEQLKWLANLLVTCPQETTIRAKKRNRVGAAVGFHLIILVIGGHKRNEAKLSFRARSAHMWNWTLHAATARVTSHVSDWSVF